MCYITAESTPLDVRKAAFRISPSRPSSLHQKLRGGSWGRYTLQETRGEVTGKPGDVIIHLDVPLQSLDYPNMRSSTNIHYTLVLSQHLKESRATNCDCRLVDHYLYDDALDTDRTYFEVTKPSLSFIAFHAPEPVARASWLALAPMAERPERKWHMRALV